MASAFKSIGAAEYDAEVVASKEPVVVFFWAPWSDPCRAFIPALEELVARKPRRARLVKVNVDQHPEAARAAKLGAIPTLLLYRAGQVTASVVGTGAEKEVEAFFEQADAAG